jgi:hypothetical protein
MIYDKMHQLLTKGFNKTKEQIRICFFNVFVTCLPDNEIQCNGQCTGITDKAILLNVHKVRLLQILKFLKWRFFALFLFNFITFFISLVEIWLV